MPSPLDSLIQINGSGVKASSRYSGAFGSLDVHIRDLFPVIKRAWLSVVPTLEIPACWDNKNTQMLSQHFI